MKRFLHNVAKRIKSRLDGRSATEYVVESDPVGATIRWLTLENETGSLSFSWESVTTVDTFKRDLFSVDCVCLAFETADGWIEINEDMNGWATFLDVLETSLPGFPVLDKWLYDVTTPAFETNHTRLWTKEQTGQNKKMRETH